MDQMTARISSYLDENKDEIIGILKNLIDHESWAREPDTVLAAQNYFRTELEKEGFVCRLVDVGANAPTMVAVLGADRPGKPIVFGGHVDTVFPKGTLKEIPFRIDEEGRMYGPGVHDMKGGLVVALATVKVLNHLGYEERPIKFVVSGDEEINHTGSTSAQVFEDTAKGALCAFNFEPGTEQDKLVTGRKGNIRFGVTVHGVSAHAQMANAPGVVSAIREMAYKVADWHAITDWDRGTSVNVGLIHGGTAANTVPDLCTAELDIRFTTAAEMERAKSQFEEVCRKTYLEGTKTEWEYLCIMDVFETTDGVKKLFGFMQDVAKKHGFAVPGSQYRGGGSDAAYFARAGVPTLCGCGVMGNYMHTLREYATLESLLSQPKLLATAILEMNDQLTVAE